MLVGSIKNNANSTNRGGSNFYTAKRTEMFLSKDDKKYIESRLSGSIEKGEKFIICNT